MENKEKVKDFWNTASCGEELYLKGFELDDYLYQSKIRYELEPEILSFGNFNTLLNIKVLEIGVGLGSDHQKIAEAGAILSGIDLTERAINHTRRRFDFLGLSSELHQGDAENVSFESETFDVVYSWGVIHHSPNTERAIDEIYRILKPNGIARIMIYHKYSIIGFMLWVKFGLLKFRPFISLKELYDKYLESPGTKAYSYDEALTLFKKFKIRTMTSPLTHGDLLISSAGQRHKGLLLTIARKLWPRWIIKKMFKNSGLYLMIEMEKK